MSPRSNQCRSALRSLSSDATARRRRPRLLLILILLGHATLGVVYSIVVPPWEAHDEIGHHFFVRYLATERRLPPQGMKVIQHNDESHQPPLYYVVAALATAWVKGADWHGPTDELPLVWNTLAATEGGAAGANMVVHDPMAEAFPYQGTILALHAARLVSVALSTMALLATYGLGRQLFPSRPELALGAAAVNAFWPQYLFVGSVVTNDIMVTACASGLIYFLIRTLQHPIAANWAGAGLFLGAALVSKNNALGLLPVFLLSAVVASIRMIRRQGVSAWGLGGLLGVSGGVLASVGWWYAHNVGVYGNPLGHYSGRGATVLKDLSTPISYVRNLPWWLLPESLRYGFVSLWASFGWGNVGLPTSAYVAVGVLCALGTGGLVRLLFRERKRRLEISLLGLAILSYTATLVPLNLQEGSSYLRGRICLPIVAPASLLLVVGWWELSPRRFASWSVYLISALMALQALLLPFLVIAPTYAPPPALSQNEIDEIPFPVDIQFGDSIQLMGYDLGSWRAKAGEEVSVTLYWRALGSMDRNYTLAVKIVGDEEKVYGARHLFPGRGNFATSLWQIGDSFRETYWMRIESPETTRTMAHVSVSFFEEGDGDGEGPLQYLPVQDPQGGPSGNSALLGRLKIAGTPLPSEPSHRVAFQVGDHISLTGYDLPSRERLAGQFVKLVLYWEVRNRIAEDYSVLVHVVNASGENVAYGDGPPQAGNYPTGLWEAGEQIIDEHIIHLPHDLPPGDYLVLAGLYRLDTLVRLPVLSSAGKPIQDDTIALGSLRVNQAEHHLYFPCIRHSE